MEQFVSKVLDEKPFRHTVKQHGTFQPNLTQFGTDRDFKAKNPPQYMPPKYGSWKNPNPPKKGIYKLMGGGKEP